MDKLAELQIELHSLETQQREIGSRIVKVRQTILGLRAVHKIGDTIEWGKPGKEQRGVVRGFQDWVYNDITYIATRLRKDGSDGATVKVYPYENPRPSTMAWVQDSASQHIPEKDDGHTG